MMRILVTDPQCVNNIPTGGYYSRDIRNSEFPNHIAGMKNTAMIGIMLISSEL
jgi:hypothetical protein